VKYSDEVINKTIDEIIESSGIGTWVWKIDTGQTIFNCCWAEIIGYSIEELEPTTIETWIKYAHPEDVLITQSQLKKVFDREIDFYVCECRMRHKDGYWVWVRDSGRVTDWDAEGNPLVMVGTHVDITMSKESELKLMESYSNLKDLQIKLDRSNRQIKDFLARFGHEIKSPISSLLGFINILFKEVEANNVIKDIFEKIYSETDSIVDMVDNILEMTRIESEIIELELSPLDLRDFIADIRNKYHDVVEKKGIQFIINKNIENSTIIITDVKKLFQITDNLIKNAVKYTSKGYITVDVGCMEIEGGIAELKVSVTDTGRGISKNNIGSIFEAYYREDVDWKEEGLGLGLAIVKNLIDLLGGNIIVESEIGTGSRFEFTIKSEIFEAEDSVNNKSVGNSVFINDILFIDVADDKSNPVMDILLNSGYNVIKLSKLSEINKAFRNNDIDLIIIDYSVFGKYELESIKRLMYTYGNKLHLIVLIEAIEELDLDEIQFTSNFSVLFKPSHPNELFRIISKVNDERSLVIGNIKGSFPLNLIQNLQNEIYIGDVDRINEIIKDLESIDKEAGDLLSGMFKKFDLAAMDKTIKGWLDQGKTRV
jgi:PAS domain S-box-containing protein